MSTELPPNEEVQELAQHIDQNEQVTSETENDLKEAGDDEPQPQAPDADAVEQLKDKNDELLSELVNLEDEEPQVPETTETQSKDEEPQQQPKDEDQTPEKDPPSDNDPTADNQEQKMDHELELQNVDSGSATEEDRTKSEDKPPASNDPVQSSDDNNNDGAEAQGLLATGQTQATEELRDSVLIHDGELPMRTDATGGHVRHKTGFTEEEEEYIRGIMECCEAGDGFDIFQLLAINIDAIGKVKKDELVKRNKWVVAAFYIFNVIKGILTGSTQVIGISIIMVDFIRKGLDDKYGGVDEAIEAGFCNVEHEEMDPDEAAEAILYHFLLSTLSFLLSSFLAFFSMDHLLHIEKGMYKNWKHAKDLNWINSFWLQFGFVVNVLVSIFSVYGSFVVIYFSTDALDMVLNSVALFFIVELDDILVQPEDYVKIHKYLLKKKDKYAAIEAREQGCWRKCLNHCTCIVGWLYQLPFQIVRYVTVGLCFVFPFVVAYCY